MNLAEQYKSIVLIDYGRPLAARAKARKSCGPYLWQAAKPGSGRSFYQSSDGLAVDERGSSFRLRLEAANDHLSGSLSRINGYYCDNDQDQIAEPIIARLPRGRGFLAGYSMGGGMLAGLDGAIYADEADAANAAHGEAERFAEVNREAEAQEEEGEE